MRVWRGPGGNREVPPMGILGEAGANSVEEGGTWGRHGFPRGSEPEASDAHSDGLLRTPVGRGAGVTIPECVGGGDGSGSRSAAVRDHGGDVTPLRTTRYRCSPIRPISAPGTSSMWSE